MKILVKISGDLVNDSRVLTKIKELTKDNSVTLIHGAGTQISNALKKRRIPYEFTNGIRQTTEEGLKVCLHESNNVRKMLEKKFRRTKISIRSPVSKEGNQIVNKNAEDVFRNICCDFDRKMLFTISDREKPLLKDIKEIEIIKLEPLQENIMRQ